MLKEISGVTGRNFPEGIDAQQAGEIAEAYREITYLHVTLRTDHAINSTFRNSFWLNTV